MDILPVLCDIDDFCQFFEPLWKMGLLSMGERQRDRAARLCLSDSDDDHRALPRFELSKLQGVLHRARDEA